MCFQRIIKLVFLLKSHMQSPVFVYAPLPRLQGVEAVQWEGSLAATAELQLRPCAELRSCRLQQGNWFWETEQNVRTHAKKRDKLSFVAVEPVRSARQTPGGAGWSGLELHYS